MLVTLREVLKDAQEKHYGVGLFNTVNLEMAKGVLAAAEELRSPVIIGTAEVLLPYASLEELTYFLLPMARKATVPVVLHYDHGLTEEKIMEALRLGFSSIMYDCSTDSYENNIGRVAQMVKIARLFGASVEGELGHVGANESLTADDSIYTQPEEALDFVSRTGVDALAVAIGTAHGAYKEQPKLDIQRLSQIAGWSPPPWCSTAAAALRTRIFKIVWPTVSPRSTFSPTSTVRRPGRPTTITGRAGALPTSRMRLPRR